uniref:Uncharacterized protein n=1 Tax=Leersia perrieri TaxID=77586 RepID=A0A0D9XWY2_9ORYZ
MACHATSPGSRPSPYMLFNDGGHNHHLYVGARKTIAWDDDVDCLEILLDGEPVILPEVADAIWTSAIVPALSVTRTKAANGALVTLDGRFKIRANAVPITGEESRAHRYGVTADDCLAHLDLAFKFNELTADVHGVVGQTYRADYINKFAASGLFAADCVVSRFGQGRWRRRAGGVVRRCHPMTGDG